VPRVDKIVGPGNRYVETAKRLLFGAVGLDMLAGPSEVLILADDSAVPAFAAADLIAQAEHDEDAVAAIIGTSETFLAQVEQEVGNQLSRSVRRDIAAKSLENNGLMIYTPSMNVAIELANRIAPEHLELMVRAPREILKGITAAGAVFLGDFSPTAVGDYIAGPSHVLPTAGTARFFSPLGVSDFIRRMSVIELSKNELAELAPKAVRLARLEGLDAHARALEKRIKH
jgi:histidinol dehydrogenase